MISKKILYAFILLALFSYTVFQAIKAFRSSLFATKFDRINFITYSDTTSFYSIDLAEDRHYQMLFAPDVNIEVPGGYGKYRVGSIGKLVALEKNPELFKSSFSHLSSSFVTLYFYETNKEIYYGADYDKNFVKPSPFYILSSSSNASVIDKIYLILKFATIKDSEFVKLEYTKDSNNVLGEINFANASFTKKSQGFFYQHSLRTEKQSIQIRYSDSKNAALTVSEILEGNGIRVSNVAYRRDGRVEECRLIYSQEKPSRTVATISEFFNCDVVNGKTDVYDIVIDLNEKQENDWKIDIM